MYDALLIVSFGGPEGPDDVMPFLENVLRGKNVPRERMLAVAEHYQHFGGVSPINAQNRALIDALRVELEATGPNLPIYWGNRNWHPLLSDTLKQMQHDGIRRALAFFTSAYSSYSGCRQYRENIAQAQETVGLGAPQIDKLRVFYNHPGYIAPVVDRVQAALAQIEPARSGACHLVFTAHSIPLGMAQNCRYEVQLNEAARLVADQLKIPAERYSLVYQSRSGQAAQPWLEPDILDHVRSLYADGVRDIVISPIGFISDHMEVLYDLDTEAHDLCAELGMNMVRAGTVGTHPRFVTMIRELIVERTAVEVGRVDNIERPALGSLGASHDVCPVNCCLSGLPVVPTHRL